MGKRRPKDKESLEAPIDLAARIGVAGAAADPLRQRVDAPIESVRAFRGADRSAPAAPPEGTAARTTPTDDRGRPLLIGAQEVRPAPLAPAVPAAPAPVELDPTERAAVAQRGDRPTLIGLAEALGAHDRPDAAAKATEAAPPDPSEMSLVATPLSTPDDWHHFELALRSVRGVSGVRTEYYRAGILKLRLRWTGVERLSAAITHLPGYRIGILGEDRTTVQVRVARATS